MTDFKKGRRAVIGSLAAAALTAGLGLGAGAVTALTVTPAVAWADPADDTNVNLHPVIDKADFYAPGEDEPVEGAGSGVEAQADAEAQDSPTVTPMTLSSQMTYFRQYESGTNYDQGLSAGDGYHAMGAYQFDNRYGLGTFLHACYNYDPAKYSMFAQFANYGWDVSNGGASLYDSSAHQFTALGSALNSAWHAAYAADPNGFSRLQDGWAYSTYYLPAQRQLAAYGVNISKRADCVKGLCWSMANLCGTGDTYGWMWFARRAGLNNSMSDAQFVAALGDYFVANVDERYSSQPEYWAAWKYRYRQEVDQCLGYLGQSAAQLATANASSVSAGTYMLVSALDPSMVVEVANGSSADRANVQLFATNAANCQWWRISKDGSGYYRLTNLASGKALQVNRSLTEEGANVNQYASTSSDTSQKWAIVPNGDGTYTLYTALGSGLALDVAGSGTANGTNIELWARNGASAQRFKLIRRYPDVAYGDWYGAAAAWCANAGLMTGRSNGTFGVGSTLTRAEIATILWRDADPRAAASYSSKQGSTSNATGMPDVAGRAWYTGAANWAVSNHVINGSAGRFLPDTDITLEQLLAIIANYKGGRAVASANDGVLDNYSDADEISPWARQAVAWAVQKSLVSGYADGTLKPQQKIGRERAAVILYNAYRQGILG